MTADRTASRKGKPRSPASGSAGAAKSRQPVAPTPRTFVLNGRQWLLVVALMVLAFMSAVAVVYTTHQSRVKTNALQELEHERNALQVEWGRLLLEQSSLVSQGRIETRAIRELGMKVPESSNVVIMKEERGR